MLECVAVVWDPGKARRNRMKHGVRFADTALVLEDPYAITITDHESDPAEERFVTLGAGPGGGLLVVVYTYRGEDIRLISARPARAHEREAYEGPR